MKSNIAVINNFQKHSEASFKTPHHTLDESSDHLAEIGDSAPDLWMGDWKPSSTAEKVTILVDFVDSTLTNIGSSLDSMKRLNKEILKVFADQGIESPDPTAIEF